jgi:hypothetical protein
MYRSTRPTSSESWGRGWAITGISVLALALLGALGYLLAGGDRVLSPGAWQVERSRKALLSDVEMLIDVQKELRLLVDSPPATLVETSERLRDVDSRLAKVARRMQETTVPPVLTGFVEEINRCLVQFGEAMTLAERVLSLQDEAEQEALLKKLRQVRRDLSSLRVLLSPEEEALADGAP